MLHALDGLYAEMAPFARGVRDVRLVANTLLCRRPGAVLAPYAQALVEALPA